MSKLSIQLKLLDILLDEDIHSGKELAEELEIKNSTIRWYIMNLIISGFQIESFRGKGGGYKLNKKMCANNILRLIES
ncbi:HTH domain-containing protein [Dethiothermospora halolimnae]|uniref:HTH domain-containing protein n=1 Tax=Dethiothermospora halolimnae TaxID=3114390 RepID=UPI003CCBAE02